jgi:hypothetical protein
MIVAVLALCMSVAGTAVAAGVFSKPERRAVKKIANKQIKKKVPNITAAAANNVLAATVNAGDTCNIDKQTGGITGALVGTTPGPTSHCDVTFPRSVANCTVGATSIHPLDDAASAGFAGVRYLSGATVRVTRINKENNFQAAGLFSIFAVCPA